MSLSWIIYLEQLPLQTFLIKTNINWGLRNEIRLLYQPRNDQYSTSLSSFNVLSFTTFLIKQSGQFQDRYGKGGERKKQILFIFGKTNSPKRVNQKVQNM